MRSLAVHEAAAIAVMVASIWLSSGTLSPYAVTLQNPLVVTPCHYLANVDDGQFRATFLMLDGAPKHAWDQSVVLRRILFPLVAYPFMKATSFEVGGFIASLLLHVIAFLAFARFLRRTVGDAGAVAGMWLLATYPGISYWAGLPYSYASIVPLSIFAFLLLWRIAVEDRASAICWSGFGIGILALGYDLLPFFGAAALGLLAYRRRFGLAAATLVLLLAPIGIFNAVVLERFYGVNPVNPNSAMYATILRSFVSGPHWAEWAHLMLRFPFDAIRVYLFSNFLFLPLLFSLALALAIRAGRPEFRPADAALLLAVAAVFLFNNLAPPYPGVQMRGSYIARLYQPAFVALIVYVARVVQLGRARWIGPAVAAAIALNAAIAFGTVTANPAASFVDLQFYGHDNKDVNNVARNVARYGRRPIGVCRAE